jgi:hypothetical protein
MLKNSNLQTVFNLGKPKKSYCNLKNGILNKIKFSYFFSFLYIYDKINNTNRNQPSVSVND